MAKNKSSTVQRQLERCMDKNQNGKNDSQLHRCQQDLNMKQDEIDQFENQLKNATREIETLKGKDNEPTVVKYSMNDLKKDLLTMIETKYMHCKETFGTKKSCAYKYYPSWRSGHYRIYTKKCHGMKQRRQMKLIRQMAWIEKRLKEPFCMNLKDSVIFA